MSKRRAAFVLITLAALVAVGFALAKVFRNGEAAAIDAVGSRPRIEKFETSRKTLPSGESTDVTVSARGVRASRYELSATCPPGASLALDGRDICGHAATLDASALVRETLVASIAETATGTVTLAAKIVEPDVPVAPWTQQVVLLRID